jgi:hypothetical protein
MRALLLGALLLVGCVPPQATVVTPTPSPPVNVSFGASPTFVARTAPPSIASFADGQTAPWPVVLYEWDGSLIRQRTESTNNGTARPCAGVRRLEARPAGLLAWCHDASSDLADPVLISIHSLRARARRGPRTFRLMVGRSPRSAPESAFRARPYARPTLS